MIFSQRPFSQWLVDSESWLEKNFLYARQVGKRVDQSNRPLQRWGHSDTVLPQPGRVPLADHGAERKAIFCFAHPP